MMKVLVITNGGGKKDFIGADEGEIAYFCGKYFCGLTTRKASTAAKVVAMDTTEAALAKAHFDSCVAACGGDVSLAGTEQEHLPTVRELSRVAASFEVGTVVRIKGNRVIGTAP